ncbi:MAG: gamma-butyrobetaine hydroxylase-like domain-containing protein [Gammaproteobacteria bacterium]
MSIQPTEINLHTKSRILEIAFEDGSRFHLPAEYLRVHSPSAEVQGHGPGQGVLQLGKEDVNIESLVQVGHYALQLFFDDNHNTGIYSWETLYDLGQHQAQYWQDYLDKLAEAGHPRREPAMN